MNLDGTNGWLMSLPAFYLGFLFIVKVAVFFNFAE